jgi:two-component system, OmpR family, sensor histidine kinase MprB
MTFRLRLALAAAAVVAVAVAVASVVVYVVMRNELRRNVDDGLRQRTERTVEQVRRHGAFALNDLTGPNAFPSGGPGSSRDYVQFVDDQGHTALLDYESAKVPVGKTTLAVAAGHHTPFFSDATVGNVHSRVFTAYIGTTADGRGIAIQSVRDLDDVDRTLHRLELILLLVTGGGVAAGAAGGALVSRSALVPVRRLTRAAERIAETGDPSERVADTGGHDELARLGSAFNTMLGALEESIETQRRFVADASHELRTPLTSLQTNIEVLKDQERLEPAQRGRLFADLEREAHEMRNLITSLLELARGDANLERTTVQVDEIVDAAVERARARFPNVHFNAHIEPTTVEGIPTRLERAVWNLLENAGKWTTAGSSVDVTLSNGELRVRDHGPGIAVEDREHVFDRFYRSAAARALPGSGLGLAIVREVAEAHGGSVTAEDAPGGGALLRLRFARS